MKFSEMKGEYSDAVNAYVAQRWRQLSDLDFSWSEKVIRYLFLVNAGGAIAVLAFIGSQSGSSNITTVTKLTLFLFVLGLIFVGFLHGYAFHMATRRFDAWRENTELFNSDQITYEELLDRDKSLSGSALLDYVLGYSSFGAFILASCFGAYSLICSGG